MQYKIPVQIENEDPIMLWLSLRQLSIIMVWWGIAYWLFKKFASSWVPAEVALIPTIVIIIITLFIALFKNSEMTFIPFVLSFIRFKINLPERTWRSWIDSFHPLDIWFLTETEAPKKENIDFQTKMDKIKELDEKLKKI